MKQLMAFVFLLLPGLIVAQSEPFTLKGKIGNIQAPAIVYLYYRTGAVSHSDSAVLKNGEFSIQGKLFIPVKANVVLTHPPKAGAKPKYESMLIYLEKGIIRLESADSLKNAVVTGSPLTNDDKRLQGMMKEVKEKRRILYAEFYGPNAPKKDSATTAGFYATLRELDSAEKKIQLDFIRANPKSLVSIDVLAGYAGMLPENIKAIDSLFSSLAPAARNSGMGKEYATIIANWKRTTVGSMAPLFTQNDTLGKPVSLADFRGKYVLIDFWASWCGPCRAENPNLVKTFQKYKDKNFVILGVSLDAPTGKENWLKAIRKDNLTWTQVSDLRYWENEVAKLYAVRGIPQNFLIDPSGKIVAKDLRGENLDKELEKRL